MKIYCPHATSFDFVTGWYEPLRDLEFTSELTLPHESTDEQFASREFLESGECDLVIAEVSYPSLGLGIELGWASMQGVPVVAMYQSGTKPSGAVYAVTDRVIEYKDENDLLDKVTEIYGEFKGE